MCPLDKKDPRLLCFEGGARDDIKIKAEGAVLHLCMWIIVPAEGGDSHTEKRLRETTTRLRIKSCYLCYMANPSHHDYALINASKIPLLSKTLSCIKQRESKANPPAPVATNPSHLSSNSCSHPSHQ